MTRGLEAHLSKGAGEMYLYDLGSDRSDRFLPRNDLHPDSNTKTPVDACALDPGVDATTAARPELQSRLPFTAVHRTVHRPQHLHGSSPSTLDARVPATKDQVHDHTAQLTIHSSQPGVSTAHSSISPLMNALSTHHL